MQNARGKIILLLEEGKVCQESDIRYLADPGEASGCSSNTFSIRWLSHPLVKISLRRRHAKMVKHGASCHKTNYIDIFPEILNLDGHQNRCVGSKVMAILLNGLILLTGGVASGRVCPAACAAGL